MGPSCEFTDFVDLMERKGRYAKNYPLGLVEALLKILEGLVILFILFLN